MADTKDVFKRYISLNDQDFSISSVYKKAKEIVDDMGYFFVEKEQTIKPEKYGDEVRFSFNVSKEYDEFAKVEITIDFSFENLDRSKKKDHGNAEVAVKAKQIFDYHNKWGMNVFNKFLFGIYKTIKKKEFEEKYTKRLFDDSTLIFDKIKEVLEA